jgi:hypothetical protein
LKLKIGIYECGTRELNKRIKEGEGTMINVFFPENNGQSTFFSRLMRYGRSESGVSMKERKI